MADTPLYVRVGTTSADMRPSTLLMLLEEAHPAVRDHIVRVEAHNAQLRQALTDTTAQLQATASLRLEIRAETEHFVERMAQAKANRDALRKQNRELKQENSRLGGERKRLAQVVVTWLPDMRGDSMDLARRVLGR